MSCVVVGVDRSDTARVAAETAAGLAAALGADLHVVMCADRKKGTDITVGSDSFHTDWLTDAGQFLEGLALRLPHDRVTSSVGDGDPAKTICSEAKERGADLIVIGNRRVQGLARVLGSVAGDVMKHAYCDVYVVNSVAEKS